MRSAIRHCACVRVALGAAVLCLAGALLGAAAAQPAPDGARSAAAAAERYWIFFSPRPEVEAPAAAEASPAKVTSRAEARRARRGAGSSPALTRPVAPAYVQALRERGIEPVVTSRWLHAVSAPLTTAQRAAVQHLPFVRDVRPVAGTAPADADRLALSVRARTPSATQSPVLTRPTRRMDASSVGAPQAAQDSAFYGASYTQLALMNALAPLARDINGRGVRIGFMDTGYRDLQHPAFADLRAEGRLVGVRDFTSGEQTNNHGGGVVSAAAGHAPGTLLGPAHQAEVLAATTEFTPFERNVEEDFFVAGLEWLERMGADVVNVSLGYTTFDEGQRSYTPDDLDGDTAVTTRAVDAAAQLGVVVVVSAGNSGCSAPANCWYYLSTPADADSAIAVGAVRSDSASLRFSSHGPTADGRTKPDVAALGRGVVAAWGPSDYAQVSGTSFASPLVAGVVAQMLQVNPSLGPVAVREILRQTASHARQPDTERGWGVVDADAAVRAAERRARAAPPAALQVRPPAPNPATDATTFEVQAPSRADRLAIEVFDVLGRRVLQRTTSLLPGPNRVRLPVRSLSPGVYLYRLRSAGHLSTGKLVVVR